MERGKRFTRNPNPLYTFTGSNSVQATQTMDTAAVVANQERLKIKLEEERSVESDKRVSPKMSSKKYRKRRIIVVAEEDEMETENQQEESFPVIDLKMAVGTAAMMQSSRFGDPVADQNPMNQDPVGSGRSEDVNKEILLTGSIDPPGIGEQAPRKLEPENHDLDPPPESNPGNEESEATTSAAATVTEGHVDSYENQVEDDVQGSSMHQTIEDYRDSVNKAKLAARLLVRRTQTDNRNLLHSVNEDNTRERGRRCRIFPALLEYYKKLDMSSEKQRN